MTFVALLGVALLSSPVAAEDATPSKEGYPDFSWDRVPLYAHLAIGNGLEPEQYTFLADRFKLITFTGGKVDDSVEPNIAKAARTIKTRNPKAKVLFYWSSDIPKHQWKLSNASFPKDGYVRPAGKGKKAHATRSFDLTQPAVRDWWSDVAASAVQKYGCDGIFVDGATAGRPGGPWSHLFGAERTARLDEGMFAMLRQAREKMGTGTLILFNPLHGTDGKRPPLGHEYLPVTDGAMVDDFDRASNIRQQSKEYMASTIETLGKASRDGKIVVFKGWPGFTWFSDAEMMKKPHEEVHKVAAERITFPLACFLAGAGEHCYFCYTWGWLGEYGTFDWYPEFDRPLGPPKGDAVRAGWTFRREFAHASVFVDLEKKTGRIDWR